METDHTKSVTRRSRWKRRWTRCKQETPQPPDLKKEPLPPYPSSAYPPYADFSLRLASAEKYLTSKIASLQLRNGSAPKLPRTTIRFDQHTAPRIPWSGWFQENVKIASDFTMHAPVRTVGDVEIDDKAKALRDIEANFISLSGRSHVKANMLARDRIFISDGAQVLGNVKVRGTMGLVGCCEVSGNALVGGDLIINGDAQIVGDVEVLGHVYISGHGRIIGNLKLHGELHIWENACISGMHKDFMKQLHVLAEQYEDLDEAASSDFDPFEPDPCPCTMISLRLKPGSTRLKKFLSVNQDQSSPTRD